MENNEQHLMVSCPFDPNHHVLQKRLHLHIVKCSKNHPDAKMVECRYNPMHILKEDDIEAHLLICKSAAKYRNKNIVKPVSPDPPRPEMDSCDSWDNEPPVGTYDPEVHCKNNLIMRKLYGGSQSMQRNFKKSERVRFRDLKNKQ